jgi:hypothetical protein
MYDDGSPRSADQAARIAMYQAVANRRLAFDTMMWQVPALCLTAQAFLLTVSLAEGSSRLARFLSATLACVVAGMCLQLMVKYRYLEIIDSRIAEGLEQELGKASGSLPEIHSDPPHRARAVNMLPTRVNRLSSYRVWLTGLAAFAAVDILIAVIAIIFPRALS